MKIHSKADTVVTAFGVALCCQGHKLFSNYFKTKKPPSKTNKKEQPQMCVSEDADKIIFIFSFMQVHSLSEGSGLARTDPRTASPVFPQKPSKAAAEQAGKYFNHRVTHGERK